LVIIKKGGLKMKILACTDGSEHSQKALEKAALLAEGSKNIDEVAVIYVYDQRHDTYIPYTSEGSFTVEEMENYQKRMEEQKEERKKILSDASKFFKKKNIKVHTIYKEGHPAYTIVKVAQEEGFDIIVIASEGLSGLKKLFLGSVSNAVIQQAKDCSVLLVK
jgi:nucleotide-binding universal stress UspA family protein